MSEAINFIDENQEALKILSKKMRELDAIDGIDTDSTETDVRAELIGRKRAIEIINGWMDELFEIKKGDISNLASDEDDLIKYREQVESR